MIFFYCLGTSPGLYTDDFFSCLGTSPGLYMSNTTKEFSIAFYVK